MNARHRIATVLAVGALCAASTIGARPAARGVALQLKRMGDGPGKKTVRAAQVVDGSTGEVLLASKVGAAGKVVLRPQSTPAFVVASVARPSGLRQGVSDVFRYEPGTGLKLKLKLERAAATVLTRSTPIATFVGAGGVATMGAVTISTAGSGPVSISGPLFTPLFNQTSDLLTWVETGEAFLRARQRELDLQSQGAIDPSTQISDSRIPPGLIVEGELTADGDHVTGELRIVDADTGEVIARIPVDTDIGDWAKLLDDLARELARRLRERPTTTTTTTSTSTTSTMDTGPTTTVTTGPPGSTTTTMPAGGECVSVLRDSYCACTGLGGACHSDADCAVRGGTTCVDVIGHTLGTYRLAGTGGRLGAIKIDGTEYGAWEGIGGSGVLIRGGCGTAAFTQGGVTPVAPGDTVCPAYYHPGAVIDLQAKREMSALTAPPGGGIYCSSRFIGWSGDVTCSGLGTCDDQVCRCGTMAKTGPFEVVATWEAVDDGGGCVPASAP